MGEIDGFVSARHAMGEPSTYISGAGAEGEGCILVREAKPWFQDRAVSSWSVQKLASSKSTCQTKV